jgi:hypothetical protein
MSQPEPQQPIVVVLGEDNTITLPDEIARQFQPTDRFALLQQGDTLILKRVSPAPVSDIVAATPDEAPLGLEEISDIIHELRSQRRSAP